MVGVRQQTGEWQEFTFSYFHYLLITSKEYLIFEHLPCGLQVSLNFPKVCILDQCDTVFVHSSRKFL